MARVSRDPREHALKARYRSGMKFLAFIPFLLAAATVQAAQPATERVVAYLTARAIDGTGAEPLADAIVLVRGERIEAIGTAKSIVIPDEAEIVDASAMTVLPGLINAHVHVATPPSRAYALAMLRRELYSGVTAVRSMADDARAVADLAREARLHEIPAPEIVYAALFAGPDFFKDPRVVAAARGETAGAVPWLRAVTPRTNLAEAVTLARGSGASAVKIYADLDIADVRRVVSEAHRQKLLAWAHAAVFPASPLEVADSGVDTMSHVCMIGYQGQPMPKAYHARASIDESRFEKAMPAEVDAVFRSMKSHGVVLDATLVVYETIERMRARMPEGQGPPTYCSAALAYRLGARAHELGVETAVGTDAFAEPDDAYSAVQREIELMTGHAGFTPLEAIRSATLVSARALGREAEMGTLAKGKLANLVFVAGDPSHDTLALRDVRFVVKRGVRYKREDYVPISAEEVER